MLRNYILLAFKILMRRKFYAFVSIFGISITLACLILVTSIVEYFIKPTGPEKNTDYILVAGAITIEQNYQTEKGSHSQERRNGPLGFKFIKNFLLDMGTPELMSIVGGGTGGILGTATLVGYNKGNKISSAVKYTDANFWRILDFKFIEGRPFNELEHQNGDYVVVISKATKDRYFPNSNAVGNWLDLEGHQYRVVGVVDNVSLLETFATSDIWIPIFATPSRKFENDSIGNFSLLIKASSVKDIPIIKDEYLSKVQDFQATITPIRPGAKVIVYSYAFSRTELLFRILEEFSGNRSALIQQTNNFHKKYFGLLVLGALLFMLLPIINLLNLNVSRILERSSEIGVRKSFGAPSTRLVYQFIVENLVVTFLGGLCGYVIVMLINVLINQGNTLLFDNWSLNFTVFGLGFVYILIFGFLSSIYPAWKMSKLDPVQALKGV